MRIRISKRIISIAACLILASSALTINAAAADLIPLGGTVGINLSSEGVMVVGIPDNAKGGESPAKKAGIKVGDIIKCIDTKDIETKEDVKEAAARLDGSPVSIKLQRSGETLDIMLTPISHGDGAYELGLWLRDGVAGIGTMTFYDPNTGIFGALGHSINDNESGVPLPLGSGIIARSSVVNVAPGKAGAPGQLSGNFDFDDVLGSVTGNTSCGIFGYMDKTDIIKGREAIPVAPANEIHTGPATILANVSGSDIKEYSIEISRVYSGDESDDRNMMITVTDSKLIEKTGGIVQGMSGSPIIQDGRLVGAVTHVLINDPERGYGVSAERMLQTALGSANKKAA